MAPEKREMELVSLVAQLRELGERVTGPRLALLGVLVRADHHLTAEEVLTEVQGVEPRVHRATVYRTLETFERLGVVKHTHLGHGSAVYHLTEAVHQHLVCESCGAVVEVPATLFKSMEKRVRQDYGFAMRPLHFAVVGRCQSCSIPE